ncbi:hypothetical protein MMJ63_21290, partial [Bacillus vallismortis]|nr:hypothetical protein [Bacillus vallismortis]
RLGLPNRDLRYVSSNKRAAIPFSLGFSSLWLFNCIRFLFIAFQWFSIYIVVNYAMPDKLMTKDLTKTDVHIRQ